MIWKGLIDKIEKIRQKPENVRIRYVCILTIVSLIFVLIIWFWSFSFQITSMNLDKKTDENKGDVQSATEMIDDSFKKDQEEASKIPNDSQQNSPNNDEQVLEDSGLSQQDTSVDNSIKPDMGSSAPSEQNSTNAESL